MIKVNIPKAKEITHEIRRSVRAEEFAPLDFQVNISIGNPVALAEIEKERQKVRDKYSAVQNDIEACDTADKLKAIIADMKG